MSVVAALALAACAPSGSRPVGADTSASVPTTSDTRIVTSGVIACENPDAREQAVFDRVSYGEAWLKPPGYGTPEWNLGVGGRGIAVADFDGDGIDDLLVPGHHQPAHFFRGTAAGFVDEAEIPVEGHQGATVADYDGDGDLDAVLYAINSLPVVLVNDGSANFTAVERADWDDDHEYPCGGSASFADYDGDGILDLFYGRLGVFDRDYDAFEACDSMLMRGVGGGEFVDDSGQLAGPLQEVRVLASGWHDFDGNGWPDLYAVADCAPSPQPNQLFLNDGGTLTHAPERGMNVRLAGMGLAVGDLNEDGLLDAVVPGIDEYAALYSDAELDLWFDTANAMGLTMRVSEDQRVGWGLELQDLDNDGYQDLTTVFGRDRATLDMPWFEPDAIHRNRGDGTFEHVGWDWGFAEETVERGLVVTDLDDDGWLDIVTREVGGLVFVYRSRCGAASWLEVRLHDAGTNAFAVGATVRIEAGGRTQMRTVTAGSTSYASSGPPDLHFGLGDLEAIDRIEVTWPSGEVDEWGPLDARQVVDLWRE